MRERLMLHLHRTTLYRVIVFLVLLPGAASPVSAAEILMSPEWTQQICRAWNQEPALSDELFESEWVTNDKQRGQKIIQLYRTDCADSPAVQMQIVVRDGKAQCVYGGPINKELDLDVDYIMHAETGRWQEMGEGQYGPMRGMLFGRLKFEGPKWEAMKNMGPFETFLLLVGKVPGDAGRCP